MTSGELELSSKPEELIKGDHSEGCSALLIRNFIPFDKAQEFFEEILKSPDWMQEEISMYGKTSLLPRQTAWYNESGETYTYSGIKSKVNSWPQSGALAQIRKLVQEHTNTKFNSVLVNRYRSGDDHLAWHSDDEVELGDDPVIASISLGATRDFFIRYKKRVEWSEGEKEIVWPHGPTQAISLSSGTLLVMSGKTQKLWEHSVPKRKRIKQERVNLTFRLFISRDENEHL